MVEMKLTTSQRRTASIVALSLTALLGLDLVYQFTVHALWRQWLPTSLAAAVATTQPATTQPAGSQPADTQPAGTQPAHTQPATTQPTPAKPTEPPKNAKGKPPSAGKAQPKELHAAIRKRNIFTPYQVRQHGLALTGVLGNIALFSKGNETIGIEEGKAEGGVKVVSIQDYQVIIEFEGKTETMELFSGSPGAPPSGPPQRSAPPKGGTPAEPPPSQAGHRPDETPSQDVGEDKQRVLREIDMDGAAEAIEVYQGRPTLDTRAAD